MSDWLKPVVKHHLRELKPLPGISYPALNEILTE